MKEQKFTCLVYCRSPEEIVHSITEEGVLEIRLALSMPPSDKLADAWILETEYTNQSPREYLSELINPDVDATFTDIKSDLDLTELETLLRSFHAHYLSLSLYPSHDVKPNPIPQLTTAFNSSDTNGNILARAFRGYPFSFRTYHGDFPSYEKEPQRAYDSTIIVADTENADGLADRIKNTLNPEIIIVTREGLVGTRKVFTKPNLYAEAI